MIDLRGCMLKQQAGMTEVRMIQPLRSVASLGNVRLNLECGNYTLSDDIPKNIAKIAIWQRQMLRIKDSIRTIRWALSKGYILISEFDDDPDHWPEIADNEYLAFQGVHAVQTSTRALEAKIKTLNPEVVFFDNCIERLPPIDTIKWDKAKEGHKLKIFFGALNRQKDWAPYINAINEITNEFPDIFEFEVVYDRDFYAALNTKNKKFTQLCDYETYKNKMSECHICFMPLLENNFNIYKSDLKLIEASSQGLYSITSPTVYAQSDLPKKYFTTFTNHIELKSALTLAATDIAQICSCAFNARQWVAENRLQKYQSQKRLDWYLSLWAKRDLLTSQLIQRLNKLESMS